jgi:hypothetical protein
VIELDVLERGSADEIHAYLSSAFGRRGFRRVDTRIELILPAAAQSVMSDRREVQERGPEILVTYPISSRREDGRLPRDSRLHVRAIGSGSPLCGVRTDVATRVDEAEAVECQWCLCREVALEIAAPAGPRPPTPQKATGELRGVWLEIVEARVSTPREAEVLAAHPRFDDQMGELRKLLISPYRLVAFEDGMFNKIRIAFLERDRGTADPQTVTSYAWQVLLRHVASKEFRPGTAWARTIAMLGDGADEGMRFVRGADVRTLGRIGRSLYNGPYQRARSME